MAIRYRRNINCLTTNQLHDLREAYQALYDKPEADAESFATIGGLHGSPGPTWCDHGTPGFLTWHRAYMRAFEKALQCVNSDVMLPFWDWSSGPTTGVPAACASPTYVNRSGATVSNPLYSGPIAAAAGGGTTARGAGIAGTSFAGAATSAQTALSSATYASFQNALNGPHGSVHVFTGGNMSSVSFAGFDPIFFLHHCNVDRLWWNWQQAHPGAAVPASELTHDLDPFNQPYTTTWQQGADVQSTDDLGYRYSNWCLWIPPFFIWDLVAVKFDPIMIRNLRDARLVLKAGHMPAESVEFRVFIDQPDANADTPIEGNPAFAGSIAMFGMGDLPMQHGSKDEAATFDIELNVTDHLRRHCDPHTTHTDKEQVHGEHRGAGVATAGAESSAASFDLKIVAVDSDGKAVPADRAHIDDIELVID